MEYCLLLYAYLRFVTWINCLNESRPRSYASGGGLHAIGIFESSGERWGYAGRRVGSTGGLVLVLHIPKLFKEGE